MGLDVGRDCAVRIGRSGIDTAERRGRARSARRRPPNGIEGYGRVDGSPLSHVPFILDSFECVKKDVGTNDDARRR